MVKASLGKRCDIIDELLKDAESQVDELFRSVKPRDKQWFKNSDECAPSVRLRSIFREFQECADQYGITGALFDEFLLLIEPATRMGSLSRKEHAAELDSAWATFKTKWTSEWQMRAKSEEWKFPEWEQRRV